MRCCFPRLSCRNQGPVLCKPFSSFTCHLISGCTPMLHRLRGARGVIGKKAIDFLRPMPAYRKSRIHYFIEEYQSAAEFLYHVKWQGLRGKAVVGSKNHLSKSKTIKLHLYGCRVCHEIRGVVPLFLPKELKGATKNSRVQLTIRPVVFQRQLWTYK